MTVVVASSMLRGAQGRATPVEASDLVAPPDPSDAVRGATRKGLDHSGGAAVPAPPSAPPPAADDPGPAAARPSVRTQAPVAVPPTLEARTDRLRAEMALIAAARAALQRGQPAQALRSLQQHAESFAQGQMVEDRRALRVEALCALGKPRQANAEVRTFVEAFPASAHIARLRALCPLRR